MVSVPYDTQNFYMHYTVIDDGNDCLCSHLLGCRQCWLWYSSTLDLRIFEAWEFLTQWNIQLHLLCVNGMFKLLCLTPLTESSCTEVVLGKGSFWLKKLHHITSLDLSCLKLTLVLNLCFTSVVIKHPWVFHLHLCLHGVRRIFSYK